MTGQMNDFRAFFTATRLLDGRVLIAGGLHVWGGGTEDYLATAELYDPASGKFTLTGSMTTPRYMHAAVRLLDGRVLIIGGVGYSGGKPDFLSSAELYDPATGTFSPTGSLPDGYWGGSGYTFASFGAATLLPDGRVVAFGDSCDSAGTCLPGAALYDPTTGTFSAGGNLPEGSALSFTVSGGLPDIGGLPDPVIGASGKGWMDYAATALPDGRVLVTGGDAFTFSGANSSWQGISTAWLYDPATLSWSRTGSMLYARVDHAAVSLRDGRVLIVGGVGEGEHYCDSSVERAVEVYDPKTGKFSATGSLLEVPGELGRESTVVVLADGRVLVAGGDTCEGVSTLSQRAEIYDPATRRFSYTKPMAGEFVRATGTLLLDGRVLIAGGSSAHGGAVSICFAELYQP
jgi:hypothetical protein